MGAFYLARPSAPRMRAFHFPLGLRPFTFPLQSSLLSFNVPFVHGAIPPKAARKGASQMSEVSTILAYGEHSIDLQAIPQASLVALARRGLVHYLGNEQSAKVSNAKKEAEAKGENFGEAEIETLKVKLVAEAVAAIHAGQIGQGNRGPSKDPLQAAIESVTRASVVETLKANGIKTPKGEETITIGGQVRTLAQMLANRYARDKVAIDKEAHKRVEDARKREAVAKAKAAALREAGPVSVEDLGL